MNAKAEIHDIYQLFLTQDVVLLRSVFNFILKFINK